MFDQVYNQKNSAFLLNEKNIIYTQNTVHGTIGT